jgi:trehalose 6-phosphate phosphatase
MRSFHFPGKRPVVFLDYDGTLSPIVDIPDRAFMTEAMRRALDVLSSKYVTAIVTGRSTEKVQNFVQLDNLVYAGSHGFDIKGPKSLPINCQVADNFRPMLEQCVADLSVEIAHIPGAEMEDNRLAVSVHYRHVPVELQYQVEEIVDQYIARHPSLVKKHGKKVFELRPRVDWNKGRAVMFILEELGLDAENVVPFYLGDDVSDEDAFLALNSRSIGKGISIIVRDPEAKQIDLPGNATQLPATTAAYSLRDTLEVEQFLTVLATLEGVACSSF